MIQAQKQQAQMQKHMDAEARQTRTRMQLEEKLAREADEQAQYEADVARMEREELELINRLKNTKLMEENAHNELEDALTCEEPGQKLQQATGGRTRGSKPASRGGRRF